MGIDSMKIKLVREGARLPQRATEGSAGYDLCAMNDRPVRLEQHGSALLPTGIAAEIPQGYVGLVFGRSSYGVKHGVTMANGVGVIDSDYRGEIHVCLTCRKPEGYTVQPGERVAQLVLVPIITPLLTAADELEDTRRGEGGFGSTGKW